MPHSFLPELLLSLYSIAATVTAVGDSSRPSSEPSAAEEEGAVAASDLVAAEVDVFMLEVADVAAEVKVAEVIVSTPLPFSAVLHQESWQQQPWHLHKVVSVVPVEKEGDVVGPADSSADRGWWGVGASDSDSIEQVVGVVPVEKEGDVVGPAASSADQGWWGVGASGRDSIEQVVGVVPVEKEGNVIGPADSSVDRGWWGVGASGRVGEGASRGRADVPGD